ncbi:hypothetical protein [Kriegella aquimaris]|uniref:Holin-X, holin superfamily III n=1 Tax=Kriegella aquimaris TaxID=192904 RepID=A0A1G9JI74_9FLAO|nr:hypothetical protein [Kriegella aquimaris]SDL37188.1 hypothetical protein SAMN04488514_101564 [Kriegella aquimaris]
MAFEALKKDLVDVDTDMRSYLEVSEEYFKLKVFKIFMGTVTSIAQTLLIGALVLSALVLISIGASLALNEVLNSFYFGFIITGIFYLLIALGCYFFRDKLNGPLLRKFSKQYFDRL